MNTASDQEHIDALNEWCNCEPLQVCITCDKRRLVAVLAHVKLALRHPQANGEAAKAAQEFVDAVIAVIGATHPAAADAFDCH